jgi:hypothetical protein
MRNLIYAAIALIAVTVFIWSKSSLVGPQVMTASAVGRVETSRPAEPTPGISPFEITVKHGKNLPVERWDAF